MQSEANLCSNCGKFSQPGIVAKRPLIDALNDWVANWELANPKIGSVLADLQAKEIGLVPASRVGIAVALLVFAGVMLVSWANPSGNWYGFRGALSAALLASFVLAWDRAVKSNPPKEPTQPRPPAAVRVLQHDINLAVVQVITALFAFHWATHWQMDFAVLAAIATILLAIPLAQTKGAKALAITLASISAVYVLFIWTVAADMPSLSMIGSNYAISDTLVSPWPYIVVCLIIAAFPPIQQLKVRRFGVGNIKGDIHVRAFGSTVPVAIGDRPPPSGPA